jgi:hypothetical protein
MMSDIEGGRDFLSSEWYDERLDDKSSVSELRYASLFGSGRGEMGGRMVVDFKVDSEGG